jgi:hypothetical protein
MTAMLRRLAAGGVLVLVSGLTACSDDGGGNAADAPSDASLDEFCEAFNGLVADVLAKASADPDAMVRAVKEWAADIGELGTPTEMPDEARSGFELFIEQAADLDEDAGLEDLQKLGSELSEGDQAAGQAFTEWTQENCPLDE